MGGPWPHDMGRTDRKDSSVGRKDSSAQNEVWSLLLISLRVKWKILILESSETCVC